MKYIGADMVIYYALLGRSQVSSEQLSRMHKRLVDEIDEVLVDTTLRSIQNVVSSLPSVYELEQQDGSFLVRRKSGAVSMFLDGGFLNECFSPFFDDKEFARIKEILIADGQ